MLCVREYWTNLGLPFWNLQFKGKETYSAYFVGYRMLNVSPFKMIYKYAGIAKIGENGKIST